MVLDFAAGGELFTHLVKKGKFNVDESTFYIAELTIALGYLHSKGIIYRDLKLENVLLDREGHVLLTDFGLSHKFSDTVGVRKTFSKCGTPEYEAPEIVKSKGHDFLADWWAVGVLTYELLTAFSPFAWDNPPERVIHERVRHANYPPLDETFPIRVRKFVDNLLVKDPEERLGFNGVEEVKSHQLFFLIDWNELINRKIKPPIVPKVTAEDDSGNFDDEFISTLPSSWNYDCGKKFVGFDYAPPEREFGPSGGLSPVVESPSELAMLRKKSSAGIS